MDETSGIIYSTNEPVKTLTDSGSHSDLVMRPAKNFHWAYKKHFQLWIYGVAKDRQSTIEKALKRLERSGRLVSIQDEGRRYPKIYAIPTHTKDWRPSLKRHELGCTDTLVRIYRSDMNCEVKAEYVFKGCGVLPDWGIRYPNGKILCGEFSTENNVDENRVIPSKLRVYQEAFDRIEDRFQAKPIVLFILDVPRDRVRALVAHWRPEGQFYFTDYATFATVPLGEHLTAPIYFYSDRKEYPLR